MALEKLTLRVEGLTPTNTSELESALSALKLSSVLDASTSTVTATVLGDSGALISALTTDSTKAVITSRTPRTTLQITDLTAASVETAIASARRHGGDDVSPVLDAGLLHMFYAGDVGKLVAAVAEDTGLHVAHVPPTVLRISGMSCQSCVKAVTDAAVEAGAWDVHVSLDTAIGKMGFVGEVGEIVDKVKQAGLEAKQIPRVVLNVVGMGCSGCVGAVTRSAEAVGAVDVHVDLDSGIGTMFYDGDLEILIARIKKGSGKESTVVEDAPPATQNGS